MVVHPQIPRIIGWVDGMMLGPLYISSCWTQSIIKEDLQETIMLLEHFGTPKNMWMFFSRFSQFCMVKLWGLLCWFAHGRPATTTRSRIPRNWWRCLHRKKQWVNHSARPWVVENQRNIHWKSWNIIRNIHGATSGKVNGTIGHIEVLRFDHASGPNLEVSTGLQRQWTSSQVLNNFLGEYNTMAKRGMDLVLFMAAAQHVSQMAWGAQGRIDASKGMSFW